MVDTGDKSITAPGRAVLPDGSIACELLEGGIHTEFGLLHLFDQDLLTVSSPTALCGNAEA